MALRSLFLTLMYISVSRLVERSVDITHSDGDVEGRRHGSGCHMTDDSTCGIAESHSRDGGTPRSMSSNPTSLRFRPLGFSEPADTLCPGNRPLASENLVIQPQTGLERRCGVIDIVTRRGRSPISSLRVSRATQSDRLNAETRLRPRTRRSTVCRASSLAAYISHPPAPVYPVMEKITLTPPSISFLNV